MGAQRTSIPLAGALVVLMALAVVLAPNGRAWAQGGDDAAAAEAASIRTAIEAVLDPDPKRPALRLPSVRFDTPGDLTVVFALRDEGSVEGIQAAALTDTLTILRAVYEGAGDNRVRTTTVLGTFAIEGTRGVRESRVLRVVLSAERAFGVDWASVAPQALPDLVDLWRFYPPFGAEGPGADRLGDAPAAIISSPIDIGGRLLFLRCIGAGEPTVILEAGYGDAGTIWAPVQLPVSGFARVCSYDRAGLERSDAASTLPRTAQDVVADLHALLAAASVTPPYVLVGHSIGGLYSRLYAATFPREIAGLVLVDAWHEDYDAGLRALVSEEQWADYQATLAADPDYEVVDLDASFEQVRAAGPLPPVPLLVLSHGRPIEASCCPANWPVEAAERLWQQLQGELVRLVPVGRRIVVAGSGHQMNQANPAAVVDAVRVVVEAVRRPDSWPPS